MPYRQARASTLAASAAPFRPSQRCRQSTETSAQRKGLAKPLLSVPPPAASQQAACFPEELSARERLERLRARGADVLADLNGTSSHENRPAVAVHRATPLTTTPAAAPFPVGPLVRANNEGTQASLCCSSGAAAMVGRVAEPASKNRKEILSTKVCGEELPPRCNFKEGFTDVEPAAVAALQPLDAEAEAEVEATAARAQRTAAEWKAKLSGGSTPTTSGGSRGRSTPAMNRDAAPAYVTLLGRAGPHGVVTKVPQAGCGFDPTMPLKKDAPAFLTSEPPRSLEEDEQEPTKDVEISLSVAAAMLTGRALKL